MSEDCAVMPPTTTDHCDTKSPSGRRHSIDDILGKDEQMSSGSESSSESGTSSPPSEREDGSPAPPPPPLQTITTMQQDAVVVALQQSQISATGGESIKKKIAASVPSIIPSGIVSESALELSLGS